MRRSLSVIPFFDQCTFAAIARTNDHVPGQAIQIFRGVQMALKLVLPAIEVVVLLLDISTDGVVELNFRLQLEFSRCCTRLMTFRLSQQTATKTNTAVTNQRLNNVSNG